MSRLKTSDILLHCEDKKESDHDLFRLSIAAETSGEDVPRVQNVIPLPGFCIKTKDDDGQKVFVNICTSDDLPPPPDIGEAELTRILNSDEPSSFKVPMSLGLPRSEADKGGQLCSVMDVVINDSFHKKTQHSQLFNTFLITLVLEGLENKHNIKLNKNEWVLLKNKKYFGTGPMPNVTIQKKLISEVAGLPNKLRENLSHRIADEKSTKPNQFQEISSRRIADQKSTPNTPEFILIQDPPEGSPVSVSAEIKLPGITSAANLQLRINDDRIVLNASVGERKMYFMDIFLPLNVNPNGAVARFHTENQILYLALPCESMPKV